MIPPLLNFCRFSIRMGASRGIAYREWAKHTPRTTFEEFATFWAKARELEKIKADV